MFIELEEGSWKYFVNANHIAKITNNPKGIVSVTLDDGCEIYPTTSKYEDIVGILTMSGLLEVLQR